MLSTLVKENLERGGGFVPVTAGDDHTPVTVESNMHDNIVYWLVGQCNSSRTQRLIE